MSTSQVQKLEALLARVSRNRHKPREHRPSRNHASTPLELAMETAELPTPEPTFQPAPRVAKPAVAKPAVAKPAVAKPAVAKPAVARPAVARPAVRPVVARPAVAKPAVARPVPKPAVAKPAVAKPIIAPVAAVAAPVAKVTHAASAPEPATFGGLLDRTLSLRPR